MKDRPSSPWSRTPHSPSVPNAKLVFGASLSAWAGGLRRRANTRVLSPANDEDVLCWYQER